MRLPNPTTLILVSLALVGTHRLVVLFNQAVAQKLEDRQWRRTIGDIRNLPVYQTPPEPDYDTVPDPTEGDEFW